MLRTCGLFYRLTRQASPLLGDKKDPPSRVASYAARAFFEDTPDEEEIRQKKDSRKREEAEGVLASARYARSLGLTSDTIYSSTNIQTDEARLRRVIGDPIHRMCAVLISSSISCLQSHRLLGRATKLSWKRVLDDLSSHNSSIRSKSSSLFSLSTVGCALVGGSHLLHLNKAKLPGVMQMVGESFKTGKGTLEVGLVDTSRTKYSTLKELHFGAVNQCNKVCETLQSNVDSASQTIQSIEDKRNQECSSILSGRVG
ncbi:hypothetical protein [Candidatus Similichlamydia epinepheli]|uniref:hypothetical protein n=1 Tax=Candidatus Similichlamydia epinepheli TaxID=1903953 RepID=UPI000D3B5F07|nr:hypothetical protein [Candidatus Similichlamydia epinepheli]